MPDRPKVYHITHIENLPSIIRDGFLFSEAALIARGGPDAAVGMGHIKARRMGMPVSCHPGTKVGEYVPFYFCPRSVMLDLLYRGNHPELAYHGGQSPILHLEYDFEDLASWADGHGRDWAITPTSAAASYTQFHADRSALNLIDWTAVSANDWRDSDVREHKQAEFLVWESVPWSLVRRIGTFDDSTSAQVMDLVGSAGSPVVEIRREWYY